MSSTIAIKQTDVIIIGGGLSGLSLADHLSKAGISFHLLEGRERLGGRIKVATVDDSRFDLGPSWFWLGQTRMEALVKRLDIETFLQYSTGDQMYEDNQKQIHRARGFASMEGSLRIKGGIYSIIQALSDQIDPQNIQLNAQVKRIEYADQISVTLENGSKVIGNKAILALPPRVASNLSFEPALSQETTRQLDAIPTWMGGQAKFVAVYDHAFWRENGQSGDAMSQIGPMAELHDATDGKTGLNAIFGFIGVPADIRKSNTEALEKACLDQVGRLFGKEALSPKACFIQDWAQEPKTSSHLDAAPLAAHPSYGMTPALSNLWDGNLILGSTEMGGIYGGYLEGALEAADTIATSLINSR